MSIKHLRVHEPERNNPTFARRRSVEALDIDPNAEIGAMHLVNCNREAGVKKFRKVFNRKRDAKQAF